uniref:Molybdate-anion transporter n=1 Tax=Strigamia maritima TaxID=126957 RepID=T1ILD3_STRMM
MAFGVLFEDLLWNGVLAIQAGIAANMFADEFHFGPVSPFMLAIPFLIIAGIFIWFTWPENYGDLNERFCTSCKSGLQVILQDGKVFLLGAVQSLFESVMYMFVFLWTPVLDPLNPPLGMVFACFMVCIMIGSSCYEILLSKGCSSACTLTLAVFISLLSMFICVFSTNAENPHILVSLCAFLLLEVSVGLYFPSIGFLRSRIIPESHRANVMNWFRVPMNIITCSGLLWLHHESNRHGNQSIFIICTVLMVIGLLIVRWLQKRLDKAEYKNILDSA